MLKHKLLILMVCMAVLTASCQSSVQEQEIEINERHKFEISPCEFKYNGKVFRLGGDIQELIDIFGPYNRSLRHAYVWDSIGIGVLCHHKTEKTSEFRICFDCCEWTDPNDKEGTMPKQCFKGGILVEGIPFGNGITIDQLNDKLKAKGSEIKLGYWEIMKRCIYEYNCNYDDTIEGGAIYNHAFLIRPNSKSTFSTFTIADSRVDNKIRREEEKKKRKKDR